MIDDILHMALQEETMRPVANNAEAGGVGASAGAGQEDTNDGKGLTRSTKKKMMAA